MLISAIVKHYWEISQLFATLLGINAWVGVALAIIGGTLMVFLDPSADLPKTVSGDLIAARCERNNNQIIGAAIILTLMGLFPGSLIAFWLYKLDLLDEIAPQSKED